MKTRQEVDLLKQLDKLKGKWKCLHISNNDVKIKTVILVKIEDKYYQGESLCSKKDRFDRKLGRAIALGRAMNNYKENKSVDVQTLIPEVRFKEDIELPFKASI